MKLYTEEQVLNMLRSFHNLEMNVQLCMLKLTPIELPTDKEIYNNAPFHDGTDYSIANHHGFMIGAKWLRDKIQGGNQ